MEKGLPISPKHGVNPSMELCFWCGEVKGIALLGKLKDDAEAPRELILNYDPCDKCKEKFERGILIIEVTFTPEASNQMPFTARPNEPPTYPTGRYLVVQPDAIPKEMRKHTKYIMPEKEFEKILSGIEEEEDHETTPSS